MVIFYTTSDRAVGLMEADEAMLMLPVWMSSTLNALWDEGWVTRYQLAAARCPLPVARSQFSNAGHV